MKADVGEAAVVDVALDVEGAVALIVIQAILTRSVATMGFLEDIDLPKREKEGISRKDVGMGHPVVLSAVVAEVVLTMENLKRENVHVGYLNAAVEQGVGMRLNVMGLVVVIGELQLMKLLRRLKNLLLKLRTQMLRSLLERKMLQMPTRRILWMSKKRRSLRRRR